VAAEPVTKKTHDGFFLRVGLGGGYFSARSSDVTEGGTMAPDRSFVPSTFHYAYSGISVVEEFSVGGTPVPGLVLGAGIFGTNVFVTKRDVMRAAGLAFPPDKDNAGITSISLVCPFVDHYINPSAGFHFLGGPCVAISSFPGSGWGGGVGMNAGIGYEAWIGDQWSLGALARFQYARVWLDQPTGIILPGLLLVATYH
jgi:hypothetical protein